jgi:hypothetical protein
MVGQQVNVEIRPMEPEDISGILVVDRKISGVQRALTYRDLVREAPGGQIDPVVALNSALRFTPLEIMPRSVSSPAIAGLEFLTG